MQENLSWEFSCNKTMSCFISCVQNVLGCCMFLPRVSRQFSETGKYCRILWLYLPIFIVSQIWCNSTDRQITLLLMLLCCKYICVYDDALHTQTPLTPLLILWYFLLNLVKKTCFYWTIHSLYTISTLVP